MQAGVSQSWWDLWLLHACAYTSIMCHMPWPWAALHSHASWESPHLSVCEEDVAALRQLC